MKLHEPNFAECKFEKLYEDFSYARLIAALCLRQ